MKTIEGGDAISAEADWRGSVGAVFTAKKEIHLPAESPLSFALGRSLTVSRTRLAITGKPINTGRYHGFLGVFFAFNSSSSLRRRLCRRDRFQA